MKKIGILSIQGDIEEHEKAVTKLGHESVRVLHAQQIQDLTHLILPGGESTTMSLFLKEAEGKGLKEAIQKRVTSGDLAAFGTCAGAILLAEKVISETPIENMKLIEVTVNRNAYGSQLHSFEACIEFLSTQAEMEAVFIRAPKIVEYGKGVEILAEYKNEPVLLKQNRVLISTFHPEYMSSPLVHDYFLEL